MIVRYKYFDGISKQDEILFNGSQKDSFAYIRKNWGVDYYEMGEEEASRAYLDLKCIVVSPVDLTVKDEYPSAEEIMDNEELYSVAMNGPWMSIDPREFEYNQNLIAIL